MALHLGFLSGLFPPSWDMILSFAAGEANYSSVFSWPLLLDLGRCCDLQPNVICFVAPSAVTSHYLHLLQQFLHFCRGPLAVQAYLAAPCSARLPAQWVNIWVSMKNHRPTFGGLYIE